MGGEWLFPLYESLHPYHAFSSERRQRVLASCLAWLKFLYCTLGFETGESDSKMLSSPELLNTRLDAEEGALRVGVGLDDLRLHVDDVALGSVILPARI
jgi:hypothetical protein